MEADVLNALTTQTAYLPGGRDRDGHPLVVIPVPFYDSLPWMKGFLETTVQYLLASLSPDTVSSGLAVILDAQKCSWRVARQYIRHVQQLLGEHTNEFLVIRPDAFWDKNRVENCARQHRKGEPTIISKSRLMKYFDTSELPEELGGVIAYNHDQWIQSRERIEEFRKSYDKAIGDLENLHLILLDNRTVRASESSAALKSCQQLNVDVQKFLSLVMDGGKKLLSHLGDLHSARSAVSQDLTDAKGQIETMLNALDRKQTTVNGARGELERTVEVLQELATLEEGVSHVTNWILTTAESMLNAQLKVGYDVGTADKLRLEHEILELQCWKTYGFYAELLYKIDNLPRHQQDTAAAHQDLLSQREWMDFVCRSFAQRLERRRNVLITSVRFFRLVAEYFDKTSDVFQSLIMGERVEDYALASSNLQKLKDNQIMLELIEREIIKEGEKLSDVLLMPVKDAVGRDIDVDYSDDISNVRDILDATKSRSRIFAESVELQKLTLDQITHIFKYETDARTAVQWMDDLYKVMLRSHTHVGANVYEIQAQKDEHQCFQETAKGTYNYGCQLLNASLALRQSCKLETEQNITMTQGLQGTWKSFQAVSQEQMTRLRVSAVFHRSVEEHCTKLFELKDCVMRIGEIEELAKRKVRLRKYLATRERLLVEVGRMVRLGRLLKTRLKEPFLLDDRVDALASPENIITESDNIMACEAITTRLTEVARAAESLDSVLSDVQGSFDDEVEELTSNEVPPTPTLAKRNDSGNQSDDWSSSVKSTDEGSFVTASECIGTPQSRSSSYQTASECRASPWWGVESIEQQSSLENDSSEDHDPEAFPSIKLLSGVVMTSNANLSFDESEHSFLTPTHGTASVDSHPDSDDTVPTTVTTATTDSHRQPSPLETSSASSSALNSINRRENLTLSLTPEELEQIENDIRNNNLTAAAVVGIELGQQIKSTQVTPTSEDSGNVSTSSVKLELDAEDALGGQSVGPEARLTDATAGFEPVKGPTDISGLTYYYQNIITKHTVKSCL
ncbi:SEC14 domain and spectrin repeat-containing protein 1-B [Anopheles bellator]|uniref:SEC14 domain and spectrin repeat-containing protein 1-B n=1 Tax=Anopheles bellator TaxID=139047 RepID=UPI00264931C9|nr:SEC14 domain and spectrin repeat-containing protein 1-B [Anopheles bellator]